MADKQDLTREEFIRLSNQAQALAKEICGRSREQAEALPEEKRAAFMEQQIASAIEDRAPYPEYRKNVAVLFVNTIPSRHWEEGLSRYLERELVARHLIEKGRTKDPAVQMDILQNMGITAIVQFAREIGQERDDLLKTLEKQVPPWAFAEARRTADGFAQEVLSHYRERMTEQNMEASRGDLWPDDSYEKAQMQELIEPFLDRENARSFVSRIAPSEWPKALPEIFRAAAHTQTTLNFSQNDLGSDEKAAIRQENLRKMIEMRGIAGRLSIVDIEDHAWSAGDDQKMAEDTLRKLNDHLDLRIEKAFRDESPNAEARHGKKIAGAKRFSDLEKKPYRMSETERQEVFSELLLEEYPKIEDAQLRAIRNAFYHDPDNGIRALYAGEAKADALLKQNKDRFENEQEAEWVYRTVVDMTLDRYSRARRGPVYEECLQAELQFNWMRNYRDCQRVYGKDKYPDKDWQESYLRAQERFGKERFPDEAWMKEFLKTERKDRTIMENKAVDQEIIKTEQQEKKSMATSRRPALYEETSKMIHSLAQEVLAAGSVEPIVDKFERSENPVSRTQFRAVNALVLRQKARENGYTDPRWVTFNQAKSYSLHLKKGEKGVLITHYGIITQKELDLMKKNTHDWNQSHPNETPRTVDKKVGDHLAKNYFVFNAQQFATFPARTPDYTRDEQAKILGKIHETAAPGVDLAEGTSAREVIQEGVAHVIFSENSPLHLDRMDMSETKLVAELASGILHKELNISAPIRSESYESYIARDDDMDKVAFDKIRENPNQIVAYLNMAETVVGEVKDRVIGREMLHPEIAFSDRMKTVERSYTADERAEYYKGKKAGLNKAEIETYMKPEIQEKWDTYRAKFADIKASAKRSMDRIRTNMKITPEENGMVRVEAPRTLLEKIRTAQKKLRIDNVPANNPAKYLKDFNVGDSTFSFTMKAREKDPILAACDRRMEVRYSIETSFRERRAKDLVKAVEKDVAAARDPAKAQAKKKDLSRGR